jgi:cation diffusion facilitator family transporter
MASGSNRVVLAALAANVAIALIKFTVAVFTRSSAMLAEACHSMADTANQAFLLMGVRLSRRPPDERHPFGYATETYFWAFIVALCLFSVGAAFSIYEGTHKLLEPALIRRPTWAFVVLGASFLLELYSFTVARGEFRAIRAGRTVRQTMADARDPVVLTVLFEDAAALTGLLIAGAGIALTVYTGDGRWDGLASILVGVVLGVVAFVLARESRDLLLGESIPASERKRAQAVVEGTPGVKRVVHLRTMHLGPKEALAAIKVEFDERLTTRELEAATDEIERRLRAELPVLVRIYIEAGRSDWAGARPGGQDAPSTASAARVEP